MVSLRTKNSPLTFSLTDGGKNTSPSKEKMGNFIKKGFTSVEMKPEMGVTELESVTSAV